MPYPKTPQNPQGRQIDGHDGPVHVDQFKNSPGQSELTRISPQDAPYRSGPGVPNKRVD